MSLYTATATSFGAELIVKAGAEEAPTFFNGTFTQQQFVGERPM